jgi:hypothetical protein
MSSIPTGFRDPNQPEVIVCQYPEASLLWVFIDSLVSRGFSCDHQYDFSAKDKLEPMTYAAEGLQVALNPTGENVS